MPSAVLTQRIQCKQIFWVVVPNALERTIFSLFGDRIHNRHCHLNVVVVVTFASDEVALEVAYPAHAQFVSLCFEIAKQNIFERRAVIDPRVYVLREVDPEVGKVVFLLAAQSLFRPQVETGTGVDYLCAFEDLQISRHGLRSDGYLLFFERRRYALGAYHRAEIVDDKIFDAFERRNIAYLAVARDVFVKDLLDDALSVERAVVGVRELQCLGKSALTNVFVELAVRIVRYRKPQEPFHVEILVEGQGEHLDLYITSRQLGHQFASEQIGV